MTNGRINSLGESIRQEGTNLSSETLMALQDHRISYKDSISDVFNSLCELKKGVSTPMIVTYRIKRIESIIGKLDRYPKMKLSRMWDIAGCRCILKSVKEVYELRGLIAEKIEIRKEYDYIKSPQKEGYKSLHLFVSLPGDKKVVEVQLRTGFNHNWATLVEISDLIFDAGLKEYSRNKDLLRFHFLLSKKEELSFNEKIEIADLLSKYQYFERLSEVFSRNYLVVRKQWTQISSKPRLKYYLIETTKDEAPKISGFEKFSDAEHHYFQAYSKNSQANIVLTHLSKANYQQISVAYSNYILTVHDFYTLCLNIIESIFIESLKKGNRKEFKRYYELYSRLLYVNIRNMFREISFAKGIFDSLKSKNKKNSKKYRKKFEWAKDVQNQLEKILKEANRVKGNINAHQPRGLLKKHLFRKSILRINGRYENLLKEDAKKEKLS